jgi:hypothetical protein
MVMIFSVFSYHINKENPNVMTTNINEKYIKASNLIFAVAFVKLITALILGMFPYGKNSFIMAGILVVFILCGFLMRKGYKWLPYIMPVVMILPWVILHTNIIHVFKQNSLACILCGLQILLQLLVMDILFNYTQSAAKNSGGSAKAVRL